MKTNANPIAAGRTVRVTVRGMPIDIQCKSIAVAKDVARLLKAAPRTENGLLNVMTQRNDCWFAL